MEKNLAYKPKSIWDNADAKTRKEMEALAQRYIDFITHCKTERETVEYVRQRLAEHGYAEDFSGDRVMRSLRGKAIFAARKGALPTRGFRCWRPTPTPPALISSSARSSNSPALLRQKPTTTAVSANISGWRGPWPCTALSCVKMAKP